VAGLGLRYWVPAAAGSGIPRSSGLHFSLRAHHVQGDGGQVCSLRDSAWRWASLGVEGRRFTLLGREQPAGPRAKLSPRNCRRMTSVGMRRDCGRIQCADCGRDLHAGGADRQSGPDELTGVIVAAALAAVVENKVLGATPSFTCRIITSWPTPRRSSRMRARRAGGPCLGGIHRLTALAARLVQRLTSVPRWVHPALGGAATAAWP